MYIPKLAIIIHFGTELKIIILKNLKILKRTFFEKKVKNLNYFFTIQKLSMSAEMLKNSN